MTPMEFKSETAIGKSSWVPSFLRSAGDKLTVILPGGKEYPELLIATLTLSFDSFIDESGKPTIKNAGNPEVISDSTSTKFPASPKSEQVFVFEYILFSKS